EGRWYPEETLLSVVVAQDLEVGWNAIAAPLHTWTTRKASDIEAQVDAQIGADTAAYVVNWTGNEWDYYHKGTGTDFTLDEPGYTMWANGRGWFIYAQESGTWTPQ
ncbi:MAG: hypothetical protein KAT70_00585, partial [Thermoplasmata archaeon]|nr:hypothetical protein [Thermoplasmata archaeon]